jgi:hypothetical protein
MRINDVESPRQVMGDGQILPSELLDDGLGKSSSDMDITNSSSNDNSPPAPTTTTTISMEEAAHKLLRPPIIESTGVIATRATATILCKQNKAHCNEKLLQQPVTTQWITQVSAMILLLEHWEQRGQTLANMEMALQGLALQHKGAQL